MLDYLNVPPNQTDDYCNILDNQVLKSTTSWVLFREIWSKEKVDVQITVLKCGKFVVPHIERLLKVGKKIVKIGYRRRESKSFDTGHSRKVELARLVRLLDTGIAYFYLYPIRFIPLTYATKVQKSDKPGKITLAAWGISNRKSWRAVFYIYKTNWLSNGITSFIYLSF